MSINQVIKILIFCKLNTIWLLVNAQSTGFTTVDCKGFYLNGLAYRPLVINYTIDYANVDPSCSSYYVSPNWGYSYANSSWANPPTNGMPCVNPMNWSGRPSYEGVGPEQTTAEMKLSTDFLKIKQMGFNTIRIFSSREYSPNMGGFYNRAGSIANDFSVIDAFLLAVRKHNSDNNDNLKVILMLGRSSNCTPNSPTNCSKGEWDDYFGYKQYIEAFADRYQNYPEVMAYDLYNEPEITSWSPYHYNKSLPYDKLKISNWITEWYYAIKQFDKNHLVTIGLSSSDYTLGWDPNTMPIDFVSFHYYSYTSDVPLSIERIGSYLYYAARNITKPWIIGETGYGGSDSPAITDPLIGTEAQQKDFAALTMQSSLDCGCKGYSWWQYQDVEWGDWQNYLGLIHQYGSVSPNVEGSEKEIVNPNSPNLPFIDYASMASDPYACTPPTSYYNPNNYPITNYFGIVKNEYNNGIPNAYVLIMANSNTLEIKTYTDNDGMFTVYAPSATTITQIRISAPGYTTKVFEPDAIGKTYILTKINFNNWTKKWTNDLNNYIGSWRLVDFNKILKLDYDGDEKDDLLCIQDQDGNRNWATLLIYDNENSDWKQTWDNDGDDWIGAWNLQHETNDKFVTGDFNGDGNDELISLQIFSSADWCTLQKFESNKWSYLATNNSDDHIGPWKIEATDDFMAGDFNGDGKDELFCVRKTNGNGDWFAFLNFDETSNTWDYLYLGGNPITNWGTDYIGSWSINPFDKYYIGDFNGDGKDDLFSTQITSGNGDFLMLQTLNISSGVFDPALWGNSGSIPNTIYPFRENLLVGNFDEDPEDEILGFSTIASKFDFGFGNFNLSWSSGPIARFSDWNVAASTSFSQFVKTDAYSPAQLLAFKKINTEFLASMYLFNNKADCPTLNLPNSDPDVRNLIESNYEDFILYPNPTSGKFSVILEKPKYYNTSILIYSIHGEKIKEIELTDLMPGSNMIEITTDELHSGVYFVSFKNDQSSVTRRLLYIE